MDVLLLQIVIIGALILLGIILLLVEIFLLPGLSIAGIGAIFSFTGAIYAAFTQAGETGGYITLSLSILLCIVALVWFIRSKSTDKMALNTHVDGVVPTTVDAAIAVGDKGTTLTRLNPMGTVLLHGKRVEAKVYGGMLDENMPIVVQSIEHNAVVVMPDTALCS